MIPDSNPSGSKRKPSVVREVEMNQSIQCGDLNEDAAQGETSLQKQRDFHENREELFKVLDELLQATDFKESECAEISALHALFSAARQTLKLCVNEASEKLSTEIEDGKNEQSNANHELPKNRASSTSNAYAAGECSAQGSRPEGVKEFVNSNGKVSEAELTVRNFFQGSTGNLASNFSSGSLSKSSPKSTSKSPYKSSLNAFDRSSTKKRNAQETSSKDVKTKPSVKKASETAELMVKNLKIRSRDSSEPSMSLKLSSNSSCKSSELSHPVPKSSSKHSFNPQKSSSQDVPKMKCSGYEGNAKADLTVRNPRRGSTDSSASNSSSKSSSILPSKLSSKSEPKFSSKYLSNSSDRSITKTHSSQKSAREDTTKVKYSKHEASEKTKQTVKNHRRGSTDSSASNSSSLSSKSSVKSKLSSKSEPRLSSKCPSNPSNSSVPKKHSSLQSSREDMTKVKRSEYKACGKAISTVQKRRRESTDSSASNSSSKLMPKPSSKYLSDPSNHSVKKNYSSQKSSKEDASKINRSEYKVSERAKQSGKNSRRESIDSSASSSSSSLSSKSSHSPSKSSSKLSTKYLPNKKNDSHKSSRKDGPKVKRFEHKTSEKVEPANHRRGSVDSAANTASKSSSNSSKSHQKSLSNPSKRSLTETCSVPEFSPENATKTQADKKTPIMDYEEREDSSSEASSSSEQSGIGWERGEEGDPPFVYAGRAPRLILTRVNVPLHHSDSSCGSVVSSDEDSEDSEDEIKSSRSQKTFRRIVVEDSDSDTSISS